MRRFLFLFFFLLANQPVILAQDAGVQAAAPAVSLFQKLLPLHVPKKSPEPYDWLAQHKEPGQSFEEFLGINPRRPDSRQQTIYLTLLGDFDPAQTRIIQLTAEFIGIYFQLPVKFLAPVAISQIPSQARRDHPQTHDPQVLTGYVLEEILKPQKPKDAFCLIAFTTSDLWPGQGWNFVFGQASMEDRVGVWSIYRNGDPSKDDKTSQLCLLRTLKTGTHEVGHMFSLFHCIFYECNMNGSNHRMESDRRPIWLCPVCLRKLQWAIGFDIPRRYKELAEFCSRNGLQAEAEFYSRSFSILEK